MTGLWKTYHLHTRDKQNNYKYFDKLDISVRDILNYQNNYRNTFGRLVDLSYVTAKLYILIISLVD